MTDCTALKLNGIEEHALGLRLLFVVGTCNGSDSLVLRDRSCHYEAQTSQTEGSLPVLHALARLVGQTRLERP